MTDFIAVDGEAIPDRYNLLMCSNGESVINMKELTTPECFDFLLSQVSSETGRRHKKKPVFVCFGLNYDVNMWLRDLSREALEAVWSLGEAVYCPKGSGNDWTLWYKLTWLPGHMFRIQKNGASVTIYEVWGFFQSSFVTALGKWGLEATPEMKFMKSHRGDFSTTEIDRVKDYCLSECNLLVQLMDKLEEACVEAEIVPRQWMGAGSLAGKLLSSRKWMKVAHRYDRDIGPDEAQEPILCAYFGGRVELLKQGEFKHVHTADIRSAYPHAITQLPSLEHSRLVHRKGYNPGEPHALWHVRWSDLHGPIMPFPVRCKKTISYPTNGEGWYHACEVYEALNLGYRFEVLEGWVLENDGGDNPPFAWIPDLFRLRAQWKAEDKPAEKVLKLALNSTYGKLAQGVGHKNLPPWQSYFWAGEVTARTRARMLEAAHTVGFENCIMISTDGLFHVNHRAKIADMNKLGGWETGSYDSLFAARAGVYLAEKDGERIARTRGFYTPKWDSENKVWIGEVDFDKLRGEYASHGVYGKLEYESKRYIGIGSALMRKEFSVWRTWEADKKRVINLMPSGKRVTPDGAFLPLDERLPPSEPYEPKGRYDSVEDRIQEADQPLKGD